MNHIRTMFVQFAEAVDQDPDEFLPPFLNRLSDELNIINNFISDTSVNFIWQSFCGTLSRKIACKECHSVRDIESEAFSYGICIPDGFEACCDLSKCLENYFVEEVLDTTSCAACQKSTVTTSSTSFKKLPNTLVLMIKRYRWISGQR